MLVSFFCAFLHKLRCLMQAIDGADIKPFLTQHVRVQTTFLKVHTVHRRYLIFSAVAFLHLPDFLEYGVVVNIQTNDGQIALRFIRLLFERKYLASLVHFCDAKAFRIGHLLQKDGRAFLELFYGGRDVVEDDVVAEEEYTIVVAYIIPCDMEAVRDAIGLVLDTIDDLYLPRGCHCRRYKMLSRPEQSHERINLVRRGDDHYLVYAGIDQLLNRVVDDRFVVYRQQMLVRDEGERVEPRARPSCKNNGFHSANVLRNRNSDE